MSRPWPAADAPEARIVPTLLICRNTERRTEIEQAVPEVRPFASAIEATLAVAREQPEAVVLNLDEVEGREAELVQALLRARPELRIYLVVSAHAEPLARQLVRSGATGYLIATGGFHRLPQMLSRTPPPPESGMDSEAAMKSAAVAARWQSLFEASCALAVLAPCPSDTILREGLHVLAEATGARRASVFTRQGGARELVLRATKIIPGGLNGRPSDFEQSCAASGAEAPKPLFFTLEAADAPTPGDESPAGNPRILATLPMRDGEESLGVVCLLCEPEACPGPDEWQPVARLVSNLARLYGAAQRRETARS